MISSNKLGMVVHNYNPSYLEGIDRRIMIGDQPQQKHRTLSKETN
jgi:hypothetical protein